MLKLGNVVTNISWLGLKPGYFAGEKCKIVFRLEDWPGLLQMVFSSESSFTMAVFRI